MKLSAPIKLQPRSSEQNEALQRALQTVNTACNTISQIAWEQQTFHQSRLQPLIYNSVRSTFGLPAHIAKRCIANVVAAYKHDRHSQKIFAPLDPIHYDDQSLHFHLDRSLVALWTPNGRQLIPFICGAYPRELLQHHCDHSQLSYRHSIWVLLVTCEVDTSQAHSLETMYQFPVT